MRSSMYLYPDIAVLICIELDNVVTTERSDLIYTALSKLDRVKGRRIYGETSHV